MGMIAVSDDVLRELERLAIENQSTPDLQAEKLLREAIGQTPQQENLVARWDRIAAMSPKRGPLADNLSLLREDRDR
jgi:hypothetical protein